MYLILCLCVLEVLGRYVVLIYYLLLGLLCGILVLWDGIWCLIIILLVSHLSFYLWCLSMLFCYDVAISYILLLSVLLFILKFICLGFWVGVSGVIFFEN